MTTRDPIYIVSAKRSAIGAFQGLYQNLPAPDIAAPVMKAVVEESGLSADVIDEVIMGCVLQAGLRQGPARTAARLAGLPSSVGCVTVNKLCGSGMKAVMMACDSIKAGTNQIVIAGGMENMTLAPYLLPKARQGMRMGHGEVYDHMFFDGLQDSGSSCLMGDFAQQMANEKQLTREAMDQFSIESVENAVKAIESGWFEQEIVPIPIKNRKDTIEVKQDEPPFKVKLDKIKQLKPAFDRDNGTITAASSSSIADGAAVILLASQAAVDQYQLKPIAQINGYASHSHQPEAFTTAPIGAMEKLYQQTATQATDYDLYEINEAFAMVTMMPMLQFELPRDKVNIHGGACAMGHPIGATGSRLIVTLIHALKQHQKKTGMASLCIGGGEGNALALALV